MSKWIRDLDTFLDRVKSVTPFRKKVREQAEFARRFQNAPELDGTPPGEAGNPTAAPLTVASKKLPGNNI